MGAVFEAVADAFDAPLETGETISPHGDQWAFVQEGIPAVMASTTSEHSGRGWGHTHADTLDKLDPRDLREVAALIAEATYRFATSGADPGAEAAEAAAVETDAIEAEGDARGGRVTHRSREEIRDAIPDGYVQELKTGGRWPYGT